MKPARPIAILLCVLTAPVAIAKETEGRAPPAASIGTKVAWRASRVPHLLWTGFRVKPDGGEVLLQTSAEVELEARAAKEGTIFVLKRCRTIRRIDQLPLETRYFASPVTRVSVKPRAGDLEIAISLRQPTTGVPRKEAGPGGSWFWVIEFPSAGDTRTTAAATP